MGRYQMYIHELGDQEHLLFPGQTLLGALGRRTVSGEE